MIKIFITEKSIGNASGKEVFIVLYSLFLAPTICITGSYWW